MHVVLILALLALSFFMIPEESISWRIKLSGPDDRVAAEAIGDRVARALAAGRPVRVAASILFAAGAVVVWALERYWS